MLPAPLRFHELLHKGPSRLCLSGDFSSPVTDFPHRVPHTFATFECVGDARIPAVEECVILSAAFALASRMQSRRTSITTQPLNESSRPKRSEVEGPAFSCFCPCDQAMEEANPYAKFSGKVQGSPTGERAKRLHTLRNE